MSSHIKSQYEQAGQGQVLSFWDSLDGAAQAAFEAQLASVDPRRVASIHKSALAAEQEAAKTSSADSQITPPPPGSFDTLLAQDSQSKAESWRKTGLDAISQGQVGVLLLAGGQGTRLGSSAPKGCYDIGLPSHKSLFQLQAERIKSLQQLARASAAIPWYIMTSGPTRKPTEDFFQQNAFFGLDPANVVFFEQGVLPCLDNDGKILLDSKSSLAVAPDGNGGLYAALSRSSSPGKPSVLEDARSRGLLHLHTYGVDNCLVRVADPVFVGYCIANKADTGVKVVRKTDPQEAVGVVAQRNGKWSVLEYSEIPSELAGAREDGSGELLFRAANIANHFFTLDFLEGLRKVEDQMPFHIARKKIPHVDVSSGQHVKPTKPNGVKMELFIFDSFPFAQSMAVLEVDRENYFSPLKNAPGAGVDCPETSRSDLLAQHKRWIQSAGGKVAEGVEIELSPLVSYAGESLESLSGKSASKSGVASSKQELESLFA